MSCDQQVLAALRFKTGGEDLRYFELVNIICGELQRKCYVCIGKHSLFFVRRDMNGLIHKEGKELMYAYVSKVVKDQNTITHLLLALTENKPPEWGSQRLFIQSHHREQLVRHLQCNWQTDHMWRLGAVGPLPLYVYPITKDLGDHRHVVQPFLEYRWETHHGYKTMVHYDFKLHANAIQAEDTGEFKDSQGATLIIQVHEPLSLDQLKILQRDHIRWVAAEYKAQLVKDESQFYVLRNAVYNKRMNLANDVAAWFAWEIIIRTKELALICILLRRQYVPPVCCTAQDIVVMMRVPAEEAATQNALQRRTLMTRVAADTLCVDSGSAHAVYHEIVQAKLDALRFDEEGLEWVSAHLKLTSRMRREAKIFVRIILRMFAQDDAFPQASAILERSAEDVLAAGPDCMGGLAGGDEEEEWVELVDKEEDLEVFLKRMRTAGDGLPLVKDTDFLNPSMSEDLSVVHSWYFRVARYFAWALDGGLLGPLFTLTDFIERIHILGEANRKTCMSALSFLLHARPQDMSMAWTDGNLTVTLCDPKFKDYVFNDRVMHCILSTEWLKKQFGRQKESEYYQCLARLLDHRGSTTLIAFICRTIMDAKNDKSFHKDEQALNTMLLPLMDLMATGGVFLATYAAAALVNLSSGEEQVKIMLVRNGIASLCVDKVKVKDDDLLCYVLMLMVNLTKETNKRTVFKERGLLPLLYELLTSSYHFCNPHRESVSKGGSAPSTGGTAALKEKILVNVAALIGQFCNDSQVRDKFLTSYTGTRNCLVYMYEKAQHGGPLACKSLFALRQLCGASSENLTYVGQHLIPHLVRKLGSLPHDGWPGEFLMQGVLMLEALCRDSQNCEYLMQWLIVQHHATETAPESSEKLILFKDSLLQHQQVESLRSKGYLERVQTFYNLVLKYLEQRAIMRGGDDMMDNMRGGEQLRSKTRQFTRGLTDAV